MADDTSLVPVPGNQQVVPVASQGTALSPTDKAALQAQSDQLLAEIVQNLDDQRLVERIANLGMDAQTKVGGKMSILRQRVGVLVNQYSNPEAGLPKNLMEFRVMLDRMNVNKLSKPNWFESMFGWLPGVSPIKRAIKTIQANHETVGESLDRSMEVLREDQEAILRDNEEMMSLVDEIQQAQIVLNKTAMLGEILFNGLQQTLAAETDPSRKSKLLDITNDVGIRVQDLRTMEGGNVQFTIMSGLTIASNRRLSQAVDRTVTIARSIIEIALFLRSAQERQKTVTQAVQSTQQYAADLLVQTAQAAKQGTIDTIALYQNPVIALDKMAQSFDEIMEAMDIVDKAKLEGITNATKGIAELDSMTARLKQRAGIEPKAKPLAIESVEVAA